jgi:hypothetical protein
MARSSPAVRGENNVQGAEVSNGAIDRVNEALVNQQTGHPGEARLL